MAWVIVNNRLTNTEFIDIPESSMTQPYPKALWRIENGKFTSGLFADIPTSAMQKPYPKALWRIDPTVNGGKPYNELMPGIIGINLWAVKQKRIHVYDMQTPQDDFDNSNGLAILFPTSCEITVELNGKYELKLTHPIDDWGKWKYLLELNIIKADGQLFRIYKKDTILNEDGSEERIVYARHIFYDLNDKLLHDVRPVRKNGFDFIDHIMKNMFDDDPNGSYIFYDFGYHSDIADTASAEYQAVSPVAALIGADNCMVNRLGGELYRNNFYFSINNRCENSRENAFAIRYGIDMLKVRETIDYSDMCTYLISKDNFGNRHAISYAYVETLLHHNITREVIFNYEENDYARFIQDTRDYFSSVYTPKVSYSVDFITLKNDERYADFMQLQQCNIGDTGIIYNEHLGINTTQKIVSKTVDVLNDQTTSIILGDFRSSLTRTDRFSGTISSGTTAADKQMAAIRQELYNANTIIMGTNIASMEKFTIADLEQRTIAELEG